MNFKIRKIFTVVLFNSCLLCLLFIGLQNSSNKSKVDLILDETVSLPIGFIVGASFISGSILGSIVNINFFSEK